MSNFYKNYYKYFEIVIADTPELLQEVFRIRFQVLCIEQRLPGFDPSLYPDGLEKDSYDRHSLHVLLRYRASKNFIGTLRLILSDPLHPEKPFPIELHTQFDPALIDIKKLSRRHTAEISRFVILGHFNRRKAERRNPDRVAIGNAANINRRCSTEHPRGIIDRRATPPLALGLIIGGIYLCAKHDIKNWLSIMDPALNRLLKYFGLDFNPAGPLINYHGLRRPYFVKVADALDKMHKEHRDVWEVMTEYGKHSPFLREQIDTHEFCGPQ